MLILNIFFYINTTTTTTTIYALECVDRCARVTLIFDNNITIVLTLFTQKCEALDFFLSKFNDFSVIEVPLRHIYITPTLR